MKLRNVTLPHRRLAGVCLAVALVGGACSFGSDSPSAQRMEITRISGSVGITREGKTTPVSGTSAVQAGDTVTVGLSGLAELRLAKGRSFELAGARARVLSPVAIALDRGHVLADITAPVDIDAETVLVSGKQGAFRVDRELAIRVGNYRGPDVDLTVGDETLPIAAYRQATIAGGLLPRIDRPLVLDGKDRWDRRLMSEAIDLDNALSSFALGLEAQLGPTTGLEFFQLVMPIGVDLAFLGQYLSSRRADLLIGLVLSAGAKPDASAISQQSFEKIFNLWREGASWGLIATEFNVTREGILSRLVEFVQRAGLRVIGIPGPATGRGPIRRSPSPSPTSPRPTTPGPTSPTPTRSPGSTAPVPDDVRSAAPGESKAIDELYGVVSSPSPG